MSLSLANKLYAGRFFSADSDYVNHQLVSITDLDDEAKVASVVLQRYTIDGLANVYKDADSSNMEIPYSEFANLNQ
jgi:hypothetical protein